MTSLRTLETRLNKIAALSDKLESAKYTTHRDEDGNLIVTFKNGDVYKVPLLKFRPHQIAAQKKIFIDGIRRCFLVRPRRSGKEVESWNMIVSSAIENPGLYLMIYPNNNRGKIVLWEGAITMPNGSSLPFIKMIPHPFILRVNNQDMSIKLTNGSVIRVIGSDIDPDKLRGANPRGAVFSEFAFSDPRVFDILRPAFRQNNAWVILQTTFNGMNHAYQLMKKNEHNDKWYCKIDSVETLVDEFGDRYVTDEMIQEDRDSGMPEYLIQQEYYSVVQTNQETLYFSNEINYIYNTEKLVKDLFIPDRRAFAFFDIGMNDSTAVIIMQFDDKYNPAIIAYHEKNNQPLEYYVRWIESTCARRNIVLSDLYIPHDGQKRDFNTGKNTVDFARDLGYTAHIVPKPTSKFNAIQSMRRMLYRTRFNETETKRLIDCLSNYSKDFDVKKGIYKDEPLHNWASHAVDAYQTMTLAIDANMIADRPHDAVIYYTEH
jgi:hypothetical protein